MAIKIEKKQQATSVPESVVLKLGVRISPVDYQHIDAGVELHTTTAEAFSESKGRVLGMLKGLVNDALNEFWGNGEATVSGDDFEEIVVDEEPEEEELFDSDTKTEKKKTKKKKDKKKKTKKKKQEVVEEEELSEEEPEKDDIDDMFD